MQFGCTFLLLPGGTKKITGLVLDTLEKTVFSSLCVQNEDIKKFVARLATPKKYKNKEVDKEDDAKTKPFMEIRQFLQIARRNHARSVKIKKNGTATKLKQVKTKLRH